MRTIILSTGLLLSTTILLGQTVMNPGALKTNAILNEVALMNADAGYTTKTLNTEQFLDNKPGESGQLIGYFKNGMLVKMNVRLAEPTCVKTDKYYLSNDSLIMFYRQERAFLYDEATKTYDVRQQTTALECRYYYDGETLLKTDSKGEPKCSDKPSDQQAKEMMATCQKYIRMLKK